jgi:predicted RNA-binding Zn-ribbon protein involved in translation (DUF1610 family)
LIIDFYTVFLVIFILVATVVGYGFYLREKNQELSKIEDGFCPKCKHKSIELIDVRGTGCSPKIITFRCNNCGYENSFTKPNSGCSI